MTVRAVILGLLGGAIICALCFFNDFIIGQRMLVQHQLPPIVYGTLVLAVLGLNFGLRRLGWRRALTGAELAVIAGLCLVACGVPGWGLAQCVPPAAIMTNHYQRTQPSWKSGTIDVVKSVPGPMQVDVSRDEKGTILDGYVNGMGVGAKHVAVDAIPWAAWGRPLAFWVPLVLSITIAVFGLALVVHRQWAQHECLPYPITVFAHALLPGEGRKSALTNRLFWIGLLCPLTIYMYNYVVVWFPNYLVPINLTVDLKSLYGLLPFLNGQAFAYELSFAVVGLAYFLRSSVSLSVGIVPYLYVAITLLFARYGFSLEGGEHLGGNYNTFLFAGGYFGVLLLMIYTGRHYYWNTLRQGLFFPAADEAPEQSGGTRGLAFAAVAFALLLFVMQAGLLWSVIGSAAAFLLHSALGRKLSVKSPVEPSSVWGMRVFLAGMLVFVAMLVSVGLDWPLAVLYAGLAVMTFVVVSRIVAETGAYHFGTYFLPGAVILGFMGVTAVGPKAIVIMGLVSTALLLAPGWCPMAFMTQALQLTGLGDVKTSKTAAWGSIGLLIFVPIALFSTLYWSYDRGVPLWNWPVVASQYPGRDLVAATQRLEGQGRLEQANSLSGLERFRNLSPDRPRVIAFIVMTVLAIAVGWCNLRFTWWPFHPVMFLFLGSFHGQWISPSLLVGCGLKVGITHYGGAQLYNRLKPLMVGLIAGSVVAALIPMLVGAVYYLLTGQPASSSWWTI